MMRSFTASLCFATAAFILIGCQTTYYGAMEKLGWHKRDILVERVEEARDEQEDAKEEFRDALEAFSAVVAQDNTNLRSTYDTLSDKLARCESKAAAVSDRIESIDSVAIALFEEWEAELEQYSSADLRRKSEQQLDLTRDQYRQLLNAMQRAESKMQPVLTAFQDQVLFLKHNLNAQAIASIRGEVSGLQVEVDSLIAEMEAAIAEADSFISSMNTA